MTMRFGVYLSLQHPIERDPREMVRERVQFVRRARELGLDSVFAGQHFLVPDNVQMLQPVPMLARVAAEAGEMMLGTGVLVTTLLNPVEVVENVSTLAAMCEGEFVLGVGVGYRSSEDAAFGVSTGRGRVFEDKLVAIRQLLDGERVNASGVGYDLEDARITLARQPRPQIWVAAVVDAGVRRAGRAGDTWFVAPMTPVEEIERQLPLFVEEHAGLPSTLPVMRDAIVAPTDDEAQSLAGPFYSAQGTSYAGEGEGADGRYVIGSPATAVASLRRLEQAGVDHVVFRLQRPGIDPAVSRRSLDLIAHEVIPAYRAGS